ncbi:unnamed protein product [Cylicocyclus nassatus]|uniref:Uncharacterized protein n=1 Tax=Cylicocyclus nassatus TaxID=53992 RepID=A0AA36GPI7_CYLNA|nr:unnamed protein product [Cylicocyclus nassatus]
MLTRARIALARTQKMEVPVKNLVNLQHIYTEKPGACPKIKTQSNYECTALCHLDGDCPETEKCCSYGCSRQCVLPKGRNPRLLPIPGSISVQERKRKRSIIIRWVMQKLTREQNAANSNLHVVQWRWGLHPEGESMTEWQTVTVRNKPYAILKHLLSPGRYYEFRVGAVSIHGSLGFSQPSQPFKLSKGLWDQIVQWTPPTSDLPIKSYQLSWAVWSPSEAIAFEEMMRRRATLTTHEKRSLDEEEEAWGIDGRDRHSVIVPSHTTQSELSGLFPNSVYIVEMTVNWINSRACSPEKKTFVVTVKRGTCREYQLNQHVDTPVQELQVGECSAAIGGLTFDCDYTLEIAEEENKRTVISTSFSTKSCDVTPAQGALPCLSLATPLFCIVHATVSCHWVRDRGTNADTVIGYRAALSSPIRDDANITILPPQTREVHYENLVPSTMYTLQIQPITNRGMGKTLSTNFVTHSKILDENVIERFPGGEIIELPLEASAMSLPLFSTFILFFSLTVLL